MAHASAVAALSAREAALKATLSQGWRRSATRSAS